VRPGGSPDDRAALGEPIADRLVFAGEAVHPTRPAMVHGAYETGLAAAEWCADAARVVVVGAGAAGIGAAEQLGDRCVVVEARDRIGGRVHTVRLGDVVADLGAGWLQQYDDNLLADRAHWLGIASVPTDFGRPLVRSAAGPAAAAVNDGYRSLKSALAAFVGAEGHDGSVALDPAAWLASLPHPERPAAREMIEADLVIEADAPVGQLSSRWAFVEPGVGDGDRWMPAGYGTLLNHLSAGADVRLNWPVRHVAYGVGGAAVHGPAGIIRADKIIVTVPISVVGDELITFDPPLPTSHRTALDHLGIGVVEKVVLRFEERWWPHDANGYFRWFDEPTSFVEWLDLSDHVGVPVVSGMISAPHTQGWYDIATDYEVALRATAALHRYAGK
jgi:Flavin containing amine oxidoreductase